METLGGVKERLLCYILVGGLAVLLYLNTISGDFVFDDYEAIENNRDVRTDTPLSAVFSNDFWGIPLSDPESHKSYRPLTILTFRWNRIAHGMWSPGFHGVNVLLHALVSMLYFALCCQLDIGMVTALTAALLFATHPIHTEAVANIVGRTELLSAIFFLLSFLSYQQLTTHKRKVFVPPMFWWVSSIGFSVLSLLSKEQGITVLGVAAAYDVFIVARMNLRDIFIKTSSFSSMSSCKHPPKARNSLTKRIILLGLSALFILALRLYINGRGSPLFVESDNPASFSPHWLTRGLTYAYLCALNLWLLFCPSRLCFDWSMGSIPLLESWSDTRNLFTLGAVLSFITVILRGFCDWSKEEIVSIDSNTGYSNNNNNINNNNNNNNNNEKTLREVSEVSNCYSNNGSKKKLVSLRGAKNSLTQTLNIKCSRKLCVLFAISLLILPFLPASNLFFPVGFVVAERVLYLPSMGACLLVAMGAEYLSSKCKLLKMVVIFFFGVSMVTYGAKTVRRNYEWGSTNLLAESAVAVNPGNAKVFMTIGNYYAQQGIRKCELYYREAIRLRQNYTAAWTNLGLILLNTGRPQEAESCYRKALSIKSDHINANTNMGHLCRLQERWGEAVKHYRTALVRRPDNPVLLLYLGLVLGKLGSPPEIMESEEMLRHSLQLRPNDPETLFLLARLLATTSNTGKKIKYGYSKGRRLEESIQLYQLGLKLQSDSEAHFEMGRILLHKGMFKKAEVELVSALQSSSNSPAQIHLELGNAYKEMKEKGKAKSHYRSAVALDSSLTLARTRLSELESVL